MRKVSYLQIIVICLLGFIQFSCSTYSGPDYQTPDQYETQHPVYPEQMRDGDFKLDWPVDKARLTQRFKPAKNPKHAGIDLASKSGTPIFAAHSGRVIYRGRHYRGYGRMVIVEYNNKWATLYAHLRRYRVKQGEFVRQGEMIGHMGRSGRATGVHLHFELLKNKKPVDPLQYLDLSRAVAKKR